MYSKHRLQSTGSCMFFCLWSCLFLCCLTPLSILRPSLSFLYLYCLLFYVNSSLFHFCRHWALLCVVFLPLQSSFPLFFLLFSPLLHGDFVLQCKYLRTAPPHSPFIHFSSRCSFPFLSLVTVPTCYTALCAVAVSTAHRASCI